MSIRSGHSAALEDRPNCLQCNGMSLPRPCTTVVLGNDLEVQEESIKLGARPVLPTPDLSPGPRCICFAAWSINCPPAGKHRSLSNAGPSPTGSILNMYKLGVWLLLLNQDPDCEPEPGLSSRTHISAHSSYSRQPSDQMSDFSL